MAQYYTGSRGDTKLGNRISFKSISYIEDIQFLLNMAFISSSEVENIYISNEIYIFFTSRVKI